MELVDLYFAILVVDNYYLYYSKKIKIISKNSAKKKFWISIFSNKTKSENY
jgi:hypothetical protein